MSTQAYTKLTLLKHLSQHLSAHYNATACKVTSQEHHFATALSNKKGESYYCIEIPSRRSLICFPKGRIVKDSFGWFSNLRYKCYGRLTSVFEDCASH